MTRSEFSSKYPEVARIAQATADNANQFTLGWPEEIVWTDIGLYDVPRWMCLRKRDGEYVQFYEDTKDSWFGECLVFETRRFFWLYVRKAVQSDCFDNRFIGIARIKK